MLIGPALGPGAEYSGRITRSMSGSVMGKIERDITEMGFFDWLFGNRAYSEDDERLKAAVDRVIEGTDPRIKVISNARERLSPAVAHALDYARRFVEPLPSCIEMTPDAWGQSPLLRAMFVRPLEVANTLSNSHDLQEFLSSSQAQGIETVYCVVGATRVERTVFGVAMDGGVLRQDVVQKTVSFDDFRLVGFTRTEALLRARIEEIVLEGLLLSALRDIADNKQRGEQLEAYRQLLLTRLRLVEQSGAGISAMLDNDSRKGRDLDQLRRQLTENESELAAIKSSGSGFDAVLVGVIDALHNAESVIRAQQVLLHLNSMNVMVDAEADDAATIELIEFSTINPERPRRVAFLVSFPRHSVVERHVDFDAMLQTL